MSMLVRWYVFWIHMKYWGEAFKAIKRAVEAHYDQKTRIQRADEAMGLCLLEESLAREMRYRMFLPHSGWEFEVSSQLGLQAARLLSSAGWSKERILRKVDQYMIQLNGEIRPESPV